MIGSAICATWFSGSLTLAGSISAAGGGFSLKKAFEGDTIEMCKEMREFKKNFVYLKPGQKYHFSGTLSLVKTVYVIRDDLERPREASRDCWTASTAGLLTRSLAFVNFWATCSIVTRSIR